MMMRRSRTEWLYVVFSSLSSSSSLLAELWNARRARTSFVFVCRFSLCLAGCVCVDTYTRLVKVVKIALMSNAYIIHMLVCVR